MGEENDKTTRETEGTPSLSSSKKYYFNTSNDNLKSLVGLFHPRSRHKAYSRKRKQDAFSAREVLQHPQSHRTLQKDTPDLSQLMSDQIIKKIEINGLTCAWYDEECNVSAQEDDDASQQKLTDLFNINYNSAKEHSRYERFNISSDHFSQPAFFYMQPDPPENYSHYEIDVNNIEMDARTTLMIKNVPNKYTIKIISDEIDLTFANTYDFLYLPWDLKNNCNMGYGFINFTTIDALLAFYEQFQGKKWRKFKSEKICMLTYARLQGLSSLIEHFQNSKVLNVKEKKYQPIIRHRQPQTRKESRISEIINQQKKMTP